MEWDTVIGLEVHAQLKTKSKLFSGAATAFGASPNSQTSFIDAALPGVLPVLNQEVITMAIRFGLAINASINQASVFERKNYFYPDLPKGYQISQHQTPIVANGTLVIKLDDGTEKIVEILRAHLEEDAGKSVHDLFGEYTGIDLNRAGTPLLEIVTTPCLDSAEQVLAYLKTLHQIVRFLGVCDGNMQEGSFRCDVNLSLKPKGCSQLGTRTELKNLNSFRFIEKAIEYEKARQQDLLEQGKTVTQETRLYNSDTNTTVAMRSKENVNDYRYFPDPDLLPVAISNDEIAAVKHAMPAMPETIKAQLQTNQELNAIDIDFLLSSPEVYYFYKDITSQSKASEKTVINWLKGHYAARLNDNNQTFTTLPISAKSMAMLLDKIQDKSLSSNNARTVFQELWNKEEPIDAIIARLGLQQIDDSAALEQMAKELIAKHPQQAAEYQAGKEKLIAFFVGQMMKQTRGQGDPELISAILKRFLQKPDADAGSFT